MTKSYPRLNDPEKELVHQIFKGNRNVKKLATSPGLDLNATKKSRWAEDSVRRRLEAAKRERESKFRKSE